MISGRRWTTSAAWKAPAVQALAIQVVAGLLSFGLCRFLSAYITDQISIGETILLEGVLAAILTSWRKLARWWIAIQLVFPVAVLTVFALQLPPTLFLVAFLFLLGLYWSTFRTQVPFYPSGPATWRAVAQLLPSGCPIQVVDIGSGLGGFVLNMAKRRPESRFIGIELAPLPWLISALRAHLTRSAATFVRGDYESLDFSTFDVVFAYLSPAAMPGLWQKFQREMRPGPLLLSYEFPIEGVTPHLSVLPHPQGPILFGWQR